MRVHSVERRRSRGHAVPDDRELTRMQELARAKASSLPDDAEQSLNVTLHEVRILLWLWAAFTVNILYGSDSWTSSRDCDRG